MARHKDWSARLNETRGEDLAWMADHGETFTGACERMGISSDALEKWGRRHRPDLLRRLRANETVIGSGARRGHVEARIA